MITRANKLIPANRITRANKIVRANRNVRVPERGETVYIPVFLDTGEQLLLDDSRAVMVPLRYATN